MAEGSEWVEKHAYIMPVLPITLGIDPILTALLHVSMFLELSGDGAVDPDRAVEAMEHVGYYLGQLPPDRIAVLDDQVSHAAAHAKKAGWSEEAVAFMDEFLQNFGLADEDGPVEA